MLQLMKRKRDYDKEHQAQAKRRRRRSVLKFANTKEDLSKQVADKAMGLAHGSGLNMEEQDKNEVAGEKPKTKKVCVACGESTHKTRRAKACKYHTWEEKDFREEIVRVAVLKATGEAGRVATAEEDSEVQSEGAYNLFDVCCDVDNMQFSQYSFYALFYTEESDSDGENSDSVGDRYSSEAVGRPVGDAISSIQAEIQVLDTMGFDDTIPLDESVDM